MVLPTRWRKPRWSWSANANDLIKTTSFAEIKVDAKYHKHIIGKGGAIIKRIRDETDTKVTCLTLAPTVT